VKIATSFPAGANTAVQVTTGTPLDLSGVVNPSSSNRFSVTPVSPTYDSGSTPPQGIVWWLSFDVGGAKWSLNCSGAVNTTSTLLVNFTWTQLQ